MCQEGATLRASDSFNGIGLPWWKRKLRAIVISMYFEGVFALAILGNGALIGIQLEMAIMDPQTETDPVWFYINACYGLLFTVELALRLMVHGTHFFCSDSWFWNYFDMVVFLVTLFEVLMGIVEMSTGAGVDQDADISHLQTIRIIRVLRLVRVFRIIRFVRFIQALRNLIYSIVCTLKSLISALTLLLMVIYVFGLLFAQATHTVLEESVDSSSVEFDELRYHWGTLPRAMYTLFQSVTGGIDWSSAVKPLGRLHWIWVVVFNIFLSFVSFAMLNVMTGVFCQSAIEAKNNDQDALVPEFITNRKTYVQAVMKLFQDIDVDRSGAITIGELEQSLEDEFMRARFGTLGLDVSDAWELFKLLDANADRVIDADEFLQGLLYMRGGAKASAATINMRETRAMIGVLSNHIDHLRNEIEATGLSQSSFNNEWMRSMSAIYHSIAHSRRPDCEVTSDLPNGAAQKVEPTSALDAEAVRIGFGHLETTILEATIQLIGNELPEALRLEALHLEVDNEESSRPEGCVRVESAEHGQERPSLFEAEMESANSTPFEEVFELDQASCSKANQSERLPVPPADNMDASNTIAPDSVIALLCRE
jgi:voltage-gated sodium channel